MMGHGVWTCKYRAGLSVLAPAVAEEQRILRRVVASQVAGLPDEAARECHAVLNRRSAGYDEVITDYPDTDMYRSAAVAVDAAVLQTRSAFDLAAVAYPDILYISGVSDDDVLPYISD